MTKKRQSIWQRIRTRLRKIKARVIARKVKLRAPKKVKKIWKVELMQGFVVYYKKGSPEYVQVRIFKFYKVKPHKNWIAALRQKLNELWAENEARLTDEAEAKAKEKGDYFKYFADKTNAEEIRQVDADERTLPFAKLGTYISGIGERAE